MIQEIQELRITKDLAQRVLNYLSKRPYRKVAAMITEMVQLKPIAEPPKEPLPDKIV